MFLFFIFLSFFLCVSFITATRWDSTKDSTDSAFGSTRYSESEDTSGTETIANYSYQVKEKSVM